MGGLFRISRMSARLNRAEVIVTGAQILQRRKALGIFSDVAGANRPEVVLTAGQNVANGRIIQNFLDVSLAEPCGSHCNWSTNSAKEESGHSPKGAAAM